MSSKISYLTCIYTSIFEKYGNQHAFLLILFKCSIQMLKRVTKISKMMLKIHVDYRIFLKMPIKSC